MTVTLEIPEELARRLVLDEAARRKLIALPDAMERLMRTSFHYPKAIIAKVARRGRRLFMTP